ncbi:MAG TPA: lipid-A-disaccharide synthase N-terminal domain-containing protein [Opitutaceae bacterium]
MNEVLFEFQIKGVQLVITPWTIIGYVGVFMVAGRWFVQLAASRKARRPVLPRMFWSMSLAGSGMLLGYFILGKNDSVNVLSNLFPTFISGYNLWFDLRSPHRHGSAATGSS